MQLLTHDHSPLRQAGRQNRVKLADSSRELSARDQNTLRQVLTAKYEYMDNELFLQDDAEAELFENAEPIAEPDTSWYHPVMDNLSDSGSRNMGSVLLTAAQERQLFLQFNYCRLRVCRIRDEVGQESVTEKQARELLHWHRRAEGYREQIAQTNLALVLAMAKRTRMSEVEFSDLVSEGNMALLRAIDKFDVARGFKFSTYACRAILKAFSRSGVKLSKYRQMFPTDFDPKLERSDHMERKREAHEHDCVDELRTILRQNRAELSDIEKSVIEHRFHVGDTAAKADADAPLTLEQVGKIIGVTKERVRQIQNKALEKIRGQLENDFLA